MDSIRTFDGDPILQGPQSSYHANNLVSAYQHPTIRSVRMHLRTISVPAS